MGGGALNSHIFFLFPPFPVSSWQDELEKEQQWKAKFSVFDPTVSSFEQLQAEMDAIPEGTPYLLTPRVGSSAALVLNVFTLSCVPRFLCRNGAASVSMLQC